MSLGTAELMFAFLDGLPLTRVRAFTVKILVASMALLIYPLGQITLLSALHLIGRESLDHDLHASLLATKFALMVLLTLVG